LIDLLAVAGNPETRLVVAGDLSGGIHFFDLVEPDGA